MSHTRISVRPARPDDKDIITQICLETAFEGKSAAGLLTIPELPALVWALPYITLPSGFGFVMVEDETIEGLESANSVNLPVNRERIVGYVVGTSDTAAYEAAAEEHWWPALRASYPCSDLELSGAENDTDYGSSNLTPLDRHYLALIRAGTRVPRDVLMFASATVHIDILPAYQGCGWGRRLMQLAVTQLSRRGARALWVGSNGEEGRRFYRKVGFRPIRDKFYGLKFDEFNVAPRSSGTSN